MQDKNWKLRRLCMMAAICAMAFAAVSLIRIPVVVFLKYEPKDVLLTIGGFLFGPLAGSIMAVVVALVELTISDTGLIGALMNAISSCLFVCIAATIYHRRKTLGRAVIGLVAGALATTAGMLLWNYLITPLYMGLPREQIAAMLWTVFLPFNLLKTGLNATLTLLLYKTVVKALRAARLLPPSSGTEAPKNNRLAWFAALFVLLTLVLALLVWRGII
ncbi:MAG: ECF transporter S component [Clostridia bacterium]|nr:ECF transporter S component [Clostridia bacterium]